MRLPAARRAAALAVLSDFEARALLHDWDFWARPTQLPPEGAWRVWLLLAGRGFGKTRTGAEWVRAQVAAGRRRIALIGPTAASTRAVMVEGESGLLALGPPGSRPIWEPSRGRLAWPNGAVALTYSADEPDRLRGPEHDALWADELAAWRYETAWDMAAMGLRLGTEPRAVVTTTPRPTALVRRLLAVPGTLVTRGSTYDNGANLPAAYLDEMRATYEGTRLGRQELMAELLEDVPGALWQRDTLDATRVPAAPALARVIVAVDPAVSDAAGAAETGIVAAGLGVDGHGYVLADASIRATPDGWARAAVGLYRDLGADRIVAEVNNGGQLVEATLRTVDPAIAYRAVSASRGKRTRAEPVAALYEQRRVHHVGNFAALEDQMCGFTGAPGDTSPDRLDALVWAVSELMLRRMGSGLLDYYRQRVA